jgi:hypothetical protein
MLTKTTKRLFKGIYQYKAVLIVAGAGWFRSGDWVGSLTQLKQIDLLTHKFTGHPYLKPWTSGFKSQEDIDYAIDLQAILRKLKDIDVRVETPWISVYTNTKSNIDALIKLDPDHIKYISIPPKNSILDENTIILPKVPFEFRVTLGKTNQEHSAFIAWAEGNRKVKLLKSCKKELNRNMSWGGTYFYISGENNLLLAKMHLGGSINKVERIIKA